MATVLIIDDDEMFSTMMMDLLRALGHVPLWAGTLAEGMQGLREGDVDLVLLDVRLPDGSGLTSISQIHAAENRPEVIILTAFGDTQGADLAIQSGAWDYLEKASGARALTLPIVRALQYREAKIPSRQEQGFKRSGILGSGTVMEECLALAARAASGLTSVLITGETGTGKELFARAIHANSDRRDRNFVAVDCGALPPTLVESVLFGHEKGVFTGADRARDGLVRHADGGTLFLDELGELPLDVQKTFLRVLQERRFRPIGSKTEVESDFRLLSATNKDLERMSQEGRFRTDLLFRIRGSVLRLPPLREHREDITEMAVVSLSRLCARHHVPVKGVSPDFLEVLLACDWPGNVRELFHVVETAFFEARMDPTLFSKHLPTELRIKGRQALRRRDGASGGEGPGGLGERRFPSLHEARNEALTKAEKEWISELLTATAGDLPRAVALSGLSRSQLYRLMQRHGLKRLSDSPFGHAP